MISKTALIFATSAAIALGTFDLRPAAAAPEGGPAIAKQNAGADEFSSQRRRRGRGVHPAVPLAAFGAIIGGIATIAAANRRREVYYYGGGPHYYGGGPYYYAEPQYVQPPVVYHQPAPVYHHRPAPYAYRHHAPAPRHPGFHHRGHHGGHGHSAAPAPQAPPNDGRL